MRLVIVPFFLLARTNYAEPEANHHTNEQQELLARMPELSRSHLANLDGTTSGKRHLDVSFSWLFSCKRCLSPLPMAACVRRLSDVGNCTGGAAPAHTDGGAQHEPLALPDASSASVAEEGARTVMIEGQPVKLDKLGPIVLNSDWLSGWDYESHNQLAKHGRERAAEHSQIDRQEKRCKTTGTRTGTAVEPKVSSILVKGPLS
eukprot:gnl/TRDRNA2_/TRDRNA2_169173_c0_seq2.p1 gnl/TRDRNA2_/TRDRNA2_169173_c0~~gnl/TRDRNA2_/TRDRNA2_169173_c0_seq2.p1  ORF type:complete len:204 (+),score=23.64 gnl/TRDRNA2_/TRDRNA2_169173_c0_seq2:2-613(+)